MATGEGENIRIVQQTLMLMRRYKKIILPSKNRKNQTLELATKITF